jgi:hypothetical protein
MILKIFCIKLNILKYIYLSIKYIFKDLKLHFVLKMYNGLNLSGRPQKSSSTSKAFDSHTVLHTLWLLPTVL